MNSLEVGMLVVVFMGVAFIAIVKYQEAHKGDRR